MKTTPTPKPTCEGWVGKPIEDYKQAVRAEVIKELRESGKMV